MAYQIPPCQLYLITPPVIADMDAFAKDLRAALAAAPVACLQIRLKDLEDIDIIHAADRIVPIAHEFGTDVLINDRPDLVEACRADGTHIGQDDMDYYSSRELLGEDAIIGMTCHNSRELAFQAAMSGADYVAFGAFFETQTKDPKTRAELEILEWWSDTVEIPSVAIGGINISNAKSVIEAGADFIAVSSGVWQHPGGPAEAVLQLSQLCAAHSPE
ncbi:MAG: thiamine phosphate synthase [Alphaproteobacteria bacterium]